MPQPSIKLPVITERNKAVMIGLAYLLFCLLYLGAPQLALRSPTPVPMLALDELIPHMPLAIWVYLSQFGLLFCAIWFAPDSISRSSALYSMLLASFIAALIFVGFPTILERPPIRSDGLTAVLWQGLYLADVSGNCFPSLHAALAALAVFPLYRRAGRWRLIAPLWAGVIILAALATKQHVVLDILAGLIIAVPSRMLAVRYFEGREYEPA
ncbi:MAG: phosphatase PAP2 family protein [Gammaproteobacteria bacterium]|nr:phosphatase PAP2 family protein [Gammaproteobacteria bacterium]MDH3447377.1 phosphatase PAP2 family protein [Gammaproteobacteria bacterium]